MSSLRNKVLLSGVVSYLEEGAPIFYTPIFNSDHLGRITDLLFARLHSGHLSEVNFRIAVSVGVTEAFRSRKVTLQTGGKSRPLLLECGIDQKQMVIGISFPANAEMHLDDPDLVERVHQGQASTPFENVLVELQKTSDRFLVHMQSNPDLVEFIIQMDLKRVKVEGAKAQMVLATLEHGASQQSDKPRIYMNLGDLDYSKILQENRPYQEEVTIAPSSELPKEKSVLISNVTQNTSEEVTHVSTNYGGSTSSSANEPVRKLSLVHSVSSDSTTSKGKDQAYEDEDADSIDVFLVSAQSKMVELEGSFSPPAKEWAGDVISVLVAEKAKLNEKMRITKKEARAKEFQYAKTISDLEEKLKQKTYDLEKKTRDFMHYQQTVRKSQELVPDLKRPQTDKALMATKVENAKLRQQLEDVLTSFRSEVEQAAKPVTDVEFTQLRNRFDRLSSQTHELKKANKQLMERLSSSRKGSTVATHHVEEMKSRLDAALQSSIEAKKEAEDAKSEQVMLQNQNSRLKIEVNRLKQLLDYFKKRSDGSGGSEEPGVMEG